MRSVHHYFIMTMILLFLLPTGCRKDDASSDQSKADEHLMRDFLSDDYFATASKYYNPPPADPSAQTTTESRTKESMTAALKDYFAKNPKEVKKINQKYGYPVWASTLHTENNAGEGLVISFAKKNQKRIEYVLYVHQKKGDPKLRFGGFERKNIKNLKRMQSPTKQKLQKIDDMTYEQAALQVLHFEYASFQEVDCALAADLKNASGVNTGELESRSCTTWYLYVWSGNTIIDAIYLDSSCTLNVIDGTGVVQEPFNSDTGGSGWSGDNLTGYPLAPNQDISIPKISYNSSNENILKQVLIVLRLHYYYNNCLSGVTNQATSIDWSQYFDNISNYKTIPTTTVTIGGITVSASIDFNFTLSGNYTNDKFRSSVVVQDQGTTFGSGYSKESYDLFGHYSNAPLINIGVTSGTDQNFIKIISNCN